MRVSHGWLGVGDRWSTLDASGRGIQTLREDAFPVIVVGYDNADRSNMLYGSQAISPPAGQLGKISVELDQPWFLMGVRGWRTATGLNLTIIAEPYTSPLSPAGTAPAFYARATPHGSFRVQTLSNLIAPDVLGAPMEAGEWFYFPHPGLLLGPPGFSHEFDEGLRLKFESDNPSGAFTVGWIARVA